MTFTIAYKLINKASKLIIHKILILLLVLLVHLKLLIVLVILVII